MARSSTYESPRPFAWGAMKHWRPCSRPASLPGRTRIGKDVRALRVVSRRTAQALSLAYFTDFVLNIETMADIKTVREAPHTVGMAASSMTFAIPWQFADPTETLPVDCLERLGLENSENGTPTCSDLMTGIVDCLESLPQIESLSITMLPFAGMDHWEHCMRTQFSIKQNRPRRLPPQDRLTSIEISCAEYECCPLCTDSVIDIFQDYIAQCDIVKLGVIPNFNRRATFVAQINAQILNVRAEGPGRGASPLFHALKLSSITRGARNLVLHSTRHFIKLQCLEDEITVEDVHGNLSFDRLLDLLRPWATVEELDIRLRIRVPDDARFVSGYGERAPHCTFWNLSTEDEAESFVAWYAACLTGSTDVMSHEQIRQDQKQVVARLADVLPNLKKVWFWAKTPGRDGEAESALKMSAYWQWDALSSFRMAWTIDRSQNGERVYQREDDSLEGPHPRSGQKRTIYPVSLPWADHVYAQ